MRVSLKHLILLVALLSVFLTLFSSISAGYRVDKQSLIDNTLETNRVYAQKLSQTTDSFLSLTFQMLEASALDIATYIESEEPGVKDRLLTEADRLRNQVNTFDSVAIVKADGEILATSPQTLDLIGETLNSEGGSQALKERKPFISKPYTGMTGRLILFISHPVFSEQGNYLGLVAGTIYLKKDNVLNEVLGEHFYKDGSYVYVVDSDGRLIYHKHAARINEVVQGNDVIEELKKGKSGAMQVTNTKNEAMLAGYAHIPTANWGVVSQRPLDKALEPATRMMNEMILKSLPFLLLSLIFIWYLSKRIALPLQKLAYYAETSTEKPQADKIQKISTWYYEAIQLKKALAYSINFLHDRVNHFVYQSSTDPLTKLMNRRTLDETMQRWTEDNMPFALAILDIDKFKRVNDTYGHGVGDEVLKYLADQIRNIAREGDVCCRYGGEEFIILFPNTAKEKAFEIIERLRISMEETTSPCGEVVTISAGIAAYPTDADHSKLLIEKADLCLYEAKNTGRNKSLVYEENNTKS